MTDISEHLTTAESRTWLAMQFVLGELTDDQTAQFDAAMLNDPTLCDAVIEATRLTSGLMLAPELSSSPLPLPGLSSVRQPASGHRRGFVSWIVGGAVVAAMSLSVMSVLSPSKDSAGLSISGPQVALATAVDMETANVYVELLPDDGLLEADEDGVEESVDRDAMNDLMAPEWLLTAVELEQQSAAESPADEGDVF